MEAIPREYLENYSGLLNSLSEKMREKLLEQLAKVDYSDVALARVAVVELMHGACAVATDEAAIIASEFYDGIRERQVGERLGAMPESEREPEATEGAVRAFVQDLVDGKPVEQFAGKCADRLDYEIRRAANECISHNAKRDPRKPKWARVPAGAETCDFCIMLASRGFAYHSEETASHAHVNCDCRCVPSWDKKNPALKGYDPDYYLDCYEHPGDHPEIREAVNARRRELYAEREMFKLAKADAAAPLDERRARKLAELFDGAMEGRKARFKADLTEDNYARTVDALLRDIGKVYGMNIKGECLIGPKLQSAMPDGYEIWAATRMGDYFSEIQFLGEDRRRRKGNPDLLADGEYIDIKTPEKFRRVGRRLIDAAEQCRNRGQSEGVAILSSLRLEKGDESCDRIVEAKIQQGLVSKVYMLNSDSTVVVY